MRMKSYFADSVQHAIESARRELGDEAILVTSRLAPAEAGKPRLYEVVFATDAPEKPLPKKAPVTQPPGAAAAQNLSAASVEVLLEEIKGLRQQIQTQFTQGLTARPGSTSSLASPAQREMLTQLVSADVDPDLAQQLLASALERLANPPAPAIATGEGRFADVLRAVAAKRDNPVNDLRAAIAASIAEAFRVEAGVAATSDPVVMALIGPPGAGKTSAIAKIAARCGVGRNKSVLVLSADNLRVAAPEQLRGYSAVLGIRFEYAQSPRALAQLLEDHRAYGLILIDTPGFSEAELGRASELAQFLAANSGIQKHLVVPAPLRFAHMDRIFSSYEAFCPSHLLFSRMDETTAFGPILNTSMGRGLPTSFFSTGAGVPEDLAEAHAGFLAERILPANPTPANMKAAA